MVDSGSAQTGRGALAQVLHAEGPYQPASSDLMLFGQFVGAWDLECHDPGEKGQDVVVSGEVHFGWILDGRAVQDVWRVPLDPADATLMRAFLGTTVRFYDVELGAWRSTWLDPLNGRVLRFVGRQEGDKILLEGLHNEILARWRFESISADTFTWIGEESDDGGGTWSTQVMYARRRRAAPGPFDGLRPGITAATDETFHGGIERADAPGDAELTSPGTSPKNEWSKHR